MAPLYAPGLVLPSAVRGHYRRYMKISDVLRSKGTDVVTVAPESTVGELLALLAEHRIGAVVVSAGRAASTGSSPSEMSCAVSTATGSGSSRGR